MSDQYPPGSEWPDFVLQVELVLKGAIRNMMTVSARSLFTIDSILHCEFAASKERRNLLLVADGLVAVGGQSEFDSDDRLTVRWVGAFFPGPRWTCPPGEFMPLGFYEQFDLYYGFPPGEVDATFIACFGNGPCDYYSLVRPPDDFRPPEIGIERVRDMAFLDLPSPIAAEAMRRAELMNVGQSSRLRKTLTG